MKQQALDPGRAALQQRIKKTPEWADNLALGMILNRFSLSLTAESIVGYDIRNDMHLDLLSTNLYNRVLAAIAVFSKKVRPVGGGSLSIERIPPPMILQALQQDLTEGTLSEEDFMTACENFDAADGSWAVRYFSNGEVDGWISVGFFDLWVDYYMGKKFHLTNRIKQQQDPNYSPSLSELHMQFQLIEAERVDVDGPRSGNLEDLFAAPPDLPSRRFFVNIPALHACMGSNSAFYAQGSTLIAGTKGAGKTVLSTQIASSIAASGNPVLFFTTEENRLQLMYRFLSQNARIPYAELRHMHEARPPALTDTGAVIEVGKQKTGLAKILPQSILDDPVRFEKIQRVVTSLRFLDIVELTDRPFDAEAMLEDEIDKAMKRFYTRFGISSSPFIIFDWVGGALSGNAGIDLRHQYNAVVNKLEYVARYANTHSIAFCQLDITRALGKRSPDMRDISESKSMPDRVANFIAITALVDSSAQAGTDSGQLRASGPAQAERVFSRVQRFVCSKCRYGETLSAETVREFEFQRFGVPSVAGSMQRPTSQTTHHGQHGLPGQV